MKSRLEVDVGRLPRGRGGAYTYLGWSLDMRGQPRYVTCKKKSVSPISSWYSSHRLQKALSLKFWEWFQVPTA